MISKPAHSWLIFFLHRNKTFLFVKIDSCIFSICLIQDFGKPQKISTHSDNPWKKSKKKVNIICGHANSPVKSVFFCQAQTSLKIFPWILDCFARPISKFPPNLVSCLFLQPAESVRNHGYRNSYNLMDCGHKSWVFLLFQLWIVNYYV